MSSLFGQPAPLKWVRLYSSICVSEKRYPDGEAFGVSGLSWTMPKGSTGPGTVLPPAPPGTGLGELLSSVPMNGLTNWVKLSVAAEAGPACAIRMGANSSPAAIAVAAAYRRRGRARWAPRVWGWRAVGGPDPAFSSGMVMISSDGWRGGRSGRAVGGDRSGC